MSHKVIFITGSSRGIGRAAAIQAGQRGWSVAVNYQGNRAAAVVVVMMLFESCWECV